MDKKNAVNCEEAGGPPALRWETLTCRDKTRAHVEQRDPIMLVQRKTSNTVCRGRNVNKRGFHHASVYPTLAPHVALCPAQ